MAHECRYRAIVEYDGTEFLGFQIQVKGRTVQGEIEKCLEQVTQSPVRIVGAGRTDAGVHATGQVIAFDVAWKHSLKDLQRALNATFPPDIVISDLRRTTATFHPRYSALSRTYQYQIRNQPWPAVLRRLYTLNITNRLDVLIMGQASRLLIGSHNFASFGKPPQGTNTVRHVTQADWSVRDDNHLVFTITANAFLYRMVRNIVGTLIQVGSGRLTLGEFEDIFRAADLTRSAAPAPAHGLCLVNVTYPDDFAAG